MNTLTFKILPSRGGLIISMAFIVGIITGLDLVVNVAGIIFIPFSFREYLFLILLGIFDLFFSTYCFSLAVSILNRKIYLTDKFIFVNGDVGPNLYKVQFRTETEYKEIKSIRFVDCKKTSRRKQTKDGSYQSYLDIRTPTNRGGHWYNVTYLSKDQLETLVDELIERIHLSGNKTEFPKAEVIIYGKH